ncbi:MAG: TetR family transcriptional regulator [Paracoccaceae bacterium]
MNERNRFSVPPPGSLDAPEDLPIAPPEAKPAKPRAKRPKPAKPRRRDANQSRKLILQAALEEFSSYGHSGARVERIANSAGVSKPLIYDYFGDKDAIYLAALKEAYVQIREGEMELSLDTLEPEEAIRSLVRFTMNHFREKPWFITMLNTENMLGGQSIRQLQDAKGIQSILVQRLQSVLRRGCDAGIFRCDVDPVEFYVFIASLCYFPVSNIHTLRAVFGLSMDGRWLDRRADEAADMLLGYLKI